jgi:Cupredoxin-like domain
MLEQPVRTRSDRSGRQVVEITVHGGYRPASIRAYAGVPLRIVFRREDDDACSERVVFSSPRLDHRLSATGATTIDLPAQPPGQIRFTCGMGRYRGHIEIVGWAMVPRIRSLLLVLLVAAVAGDAFVVITAAGVSLVALVVIWLWGFRSSTHPT